MRSVAPVDCTPDMPPCTCLYPPALRVIAEDIERCHMLREELRIKNETLRELQKLSPPTDEVEWYQNPYVIVGGVTVSLSFGYAIGYFIAQ